MVCKSRIAIDELLPELRECCELVEWPGKGVQIRCKPRPRVDPFGDDLPPPDQLEMRIGDMAGSGRWELVGIRQDGEALRLCHRRTQTIVYLVLE